MLKSCLVVFSASFLASVTVLTPGDAEAGYVRRQGSACFVDMIGHWQQVIVTRERGLNNYDYSDWLHLACPIPEDDLHPLYSITYTNVHVYDGNDYLGYDVCACRCWTYFTPNGGSCAPSTCSSVNGYTTLSPGGAIPIGVYLFLYVDVPPFGPGIVNASGVQGYSAG
jgi:hypothetical protein